LLSMVDDTFIQRICPSSFALAILHNLRYAACKSTT
jgi:hypothetical protein